MQGEWFLECELCGFVVSPWVRRKTLNPKLEDFDQSGQGSFEGYETLVLFEDMSCLQQNLHEGRKGAFAR